ncbi:MAG: bifunctional folylpolyglutamate synthase/dihydrofolate synthase [Tepidibacillus sp.]|uniref:bifunctional folylpolyglutamate synthase/dihydrofolate synthase n=1 Tax=Tepidibacillus sp. HK-1 TaxID=1883407 RepID=UPI0008529F5D|nr:folylpolyglutamate synthase/dihydrofolate synthase family protein [Tepidibacillus sp. HK-1]GBF10824.1 folylpolyglutamate synthase [Tepidibacillus sp. HK-1]
MGLGKVRTKEEAIEWIHSLKTLGIKPGLDRMEWMLERLDHPERRVKFVHVAGTNGKGSTVSFISQVLRKSGYKVGTFTSPYLIEFTNRIQVNGKDISGEDLVKTLNQVIPLAEELSHLELGAPTEFEVVTAIAIQYFATIAYPDVVVWETGLGGRLDSTNVVHPIVSVITNVGYDHMNLLGDTIKEIAWEKAGIIKPGVPVISGVEDEEALQVIKEMAASKKAPIYQLNEHFTFTANKINQEGSSFDFTDPFLTMPEIQIRMLGPHQVKNAAVSLMALDVLRQFYAFYIDEEAFYSGMKSTFWPGRLEVLSEQPKIVIDGAHNPEGAKSLAETISLFSYQRCIMVTGILADKAISNFYQAILPIADLLIVTEPDFPRAAKTEDVRNKIHSIDQQKEVIEISNWQQAVDRAIQMADPDDLVIITGSLYMISDVRRFLLNEREKN